MKALDDNLIIFAATKSLKDDKSFVCSAMSRQPSWRLWDYEQDQ
jgi:hypothetical protein